jgi:hypothetical protein
MTTATPTPTLTITEAIAAAKAAEGDARWDDAAYNWRAVARLVQARTGHRAAPSYEIRARDCERRKIKLSEDLTNSQPSDMVSEGLEVLSTKGLEETTRMKDQKNQDTAMPPGAVVVHVPPGHNVSGIENRLTGGKQPVPASDHPVMRCVVEETDGEYRLIIPKVIPTRALTERMGKGNTHTGLVYVPVEFSALRVEFETSDGKRVPLMSTVPAFQLSFRVG